MLQLASCGDTCLIEKWYEQLNYEVRQQVDSTTFKPLLDTLTQRSLESSLIQTLVEQWWDTTHTFHINNIGEMTLTPLDFSCITGLLVKG